MIAAMVRGEVDTRPTLSEGRQFLTAEYTHTIYIGRSARKRVTARPAASLTVPGASSS